MEGEEAAAAQRREQDITAKYLSGPKREQVTALGKVRHTRIGPYVVY
jgi:hypothetical protein